MRLKFSLVLPMVFYSLLFVGCDRKAKPSKEVVVLDPEAQITVEVEAGSSVAPRLLGHPHQAEAGSALGTHSTPDYPPPTSVPLFRSSPEAGSTTGRGIEPSLTPVRVVPRTNSRQIVQPSQNRFQQDVELSAILANRQRFPVRNVDDKQPALPRYPQEFQAFRNNSIGGAWGKACGMRFPLVKILAKKGPKKPNLQEVLNANCSQPYGIQFHILGNFETDIELLSMSTQAGATNVMHIECVGGTLSDDACRLLSEMDHLRSLTLNHCKLTNEHFKQIITNEHLEVLTLLYLGDSLSASSLATVCDMPNLKQLCIKDQANSRDSEKESIDVLYRALSTCPELEYVHIERGIASQEVVNEFLGGCDRQQLRYLNISNEPLTLWHSSRFDRCPNLEELKVSIATSRNDYVDFFLNALRGAGGSQLKSLTIEFPNQTSLRGDSAAKTLTLLPRFPNLEEVSIPLRIEKPSHYESLTRMGKLRAFSFQNVVVNREMLFVLARMPQLENLSLSSHSTLVTSPPISCHGLI